MSTILVRKLAIVAAIDGLILLPTNQRNQRPVGGIKIQYASNEITPLGDEYEKPSESITSYGVIGVLTVGLSSFLLSISSRQQVAVIFAKPIYVITGVAIIPLSSQAEAKKVLEQESSKKLPGSTNAIINPTDSEASDNEEASIDVHTSTTENNDSPISEPAESRDVYLGEPPHRDSSIAEDVFERKGQYGRFAERWFSKKGWTTDKRRNQGMSTEVVPNEKGSSSPQVDLSQNIVEPKEASQGSSKQPEQDQPTSKKRNNQSSPSTVAETLLPKMLRTTKMLLSSQSFYFSYDYDITRRLGTDEVKNRDLPLYKIVDPLFFWNRHLISPLIEAGQHSFVLPLMQGFIGQRAFTVNLESNDPGRTVAAVKESIGEIIELQENASVKADFKPSDKTRDFLITLISRRSTLRPGLRYLRRGVDDEGHTANSVETEQILSDPSWSEHRRICSFTGIRGSIPLFFSQSPYSLKPIPILQHSFETNAKAFKRHFANIIPRYGDVQIVLLVDKQGGEAKIGEQYEEHTTRLNEENGINGTKLDFEWFDFHNVCRGMKFENVSLLMDSIGSRLDTFGYSIMQDGKIQNKQSGVLRTNCMDCLDRTNVVQSACGQRALEQQLKAENISLSLQNDKSTQWFNTLWADNGDGISKQYASTSALKGDYTRTRQRDYKGVLTDATLSLSRFYSGLFRDFFSQAAIDFLLGNVTDQVFEEFEANMMSSDPAFSMQKLRQNAIDTSFKIVVADQSEEMVGGWTLSCPREFNTVRTFPFEEAVLLLTDAALYAVRFDWSTEKVSSFERVDVRSVVGIMVGVYITSTLVAAQTDEQRNYGFVIKYKPGKGDLARVNTRSLSTALPPSHDNEPPSKNKDETTQDTTTTSPPPPPKPTPQASSASIKILAFKALPSRSSLQNANRNKSDRETQAAAVDERELVKSICEEIKRYVCGNGGDGDGDAVGGDDFIEERDIVSLAEAKKGTGLLEQWSYSLKRLVWA